MRSSVDHVLQLIFAKGFFKAHSGLFVFFFSTVICYCFYITPLHNLPPEVLIYENLIFTITVLTAPLMTMVVFGVWLLYTVKSWQFCYETLGQPANFFLFYSITSLKKGEQFIYWLRMQAIINIPLMVYGVMAIVVGIVYGQYIIPIIIPGYILLLTVASAGFYVYITQRMLPGNASQGILRLFEAWRKPLFMLPIYNILDRQKVVLIVSKILSVALLSGVFHLFEYSPSDLRVPALAMLVVSAAHAWIIYSNYHFEETYLSITRNFPYRRMQMLAHYVVFCLVLLLPEHVWLLKNFTLTEAITLDSVALAMMLLYYAMLHHTGLRTLAYMQGVFTFFIIAFITILSNRIWAVPCVSTAIAYTIFYLCYYTRPSVPRS